MWPPLSSTRKRWLDRKSAGRRGGDGASPAAQWVGLAGPLRPGEVTQPALMEVTVSARLCREGHSSHASRLSSTWEARELLHLVLVTLGVCRPTLLVGSFMGSHFLDVFVMALRCQALCSAGWWSQPGKLLFDLLHCQ